MTTKLSYKTLLAPLDGSELAEKTLVPLRELASRLALKVDLLYVAHPDQPELVPMYEAYIQHEAEKLADSAKNIKARGEVVGGYAADAILRYAGMNSIDLIMLASHGRSGIREAVLGSVARRVLAAANIPVWLVRASRENAGRLRRVLVPLDGSLTAEAVLPHVSALAPKRSGIEVILFRVSEPPVVLNPSRDWLRLIEEHLIDAGKVAEEYLARVGEGLAREGVKVSTDVAVGEAAEQIARYAGDNRIDLVAIASHGHSGINRWTYGNVARRVISGAPCDVLLVKPA